MTVEKRVITFGSFDVFHVGHVNILERAKDLGTYLIVGVSTDKLNFNKKGRYPIFDEQHRFRIVNSLFCVDEVFFEHSLEEKGQYITEHRADLLVMGNDWEGRFDEFKPLCDVRYLPRTDGISTTEILEHIRRAPS